MKTFKEFAKVTEASNDKGKVLVTEKVVSYITDLVADLQEIINDDETKFKGVTREDIVKIISTESTKIIKKLEI